MDVGGPGTEIPLPCLKQQSFGKQHFPIPSKPDEDKSELNETPAPRLTQKAWHEGVTAKIVLLLN